MNLFEKLKNRQEEEQGIIEEKIISDSALLADSSDFSSILTGGVEHKRTMTELLKASVGWVYACIDAIANDIGAIEILLFKANDKGEAEEIFDHELLDLLHKVNNNTTKFDLFHQTQEYLELVGEAPWLLEFKGGKPVNIFLLRPDRLTPLPPKEDGQLVGGYTYRVFDAHGGFKEITFEPEEIIFLKYADTTKALRGKGTLERVLRTFDIDETSEKYNLRFFQNSANPASTVSTDKKLGKEQRNRLMREIDKRYKGLDNAHKTLILENGLKYERMSLTQKEMDFIETMKFTRDKILAIFRVPRSILGITDDVNRANAEASNFVFADRTIKPKMIKLIEQLNEFLVIFFDDSGKLFLDFVDPVPDNIELKIKQADSGVRAGYMTINEARQIHNLEPIEGGDEVLAPSTPNVEPSKMFYGEPVKIKRKWHKGLFRLAGERRKLSDKRKDILKEVENTIAEKITAVVREQLMKKKNKKKKQVSGKSAGLKVFSNDKDEAKKQKLAFQAKQLRVGEEFEEKFSKAFASIFRKQAIKVLGRFPTKQLNPKDFLLDEKAEITLTIERMTPITLEVIVEQSALAFQLLGKDEKLSLRVPAVKDFLENRVFRFSSEITKETNKRLNKLLVKSIERGDSINQTSQKIRELFDGMEKFRADRIARSEIIRATSFATEEAFIQSGVVDAKEWVTQIDERTDDACLALDGKILGLGRNYFKKGDKFKGVDLNYEDIPGPPLHSNCRCTLVAVVVS